MSSDEIEIDAIPVGGFAVGESVYIVKLMRKAGGYFWALAEEIPKISHAADGALCIENLILIDGVPGYDTVPDLYTPALDDASWRPVKIIASRNSSGRPAKRVAAIQANYRKRGPLQQGGAK